MNNKVYRLLRNNKEEGPFTAQEIISKGLKPYDLIWVDGRSAGWTYPGEMNEFKLLVSTPGVELQNRISRNNAAVSSTVQAAVSVNDNLIQPKHLKPRYKVSAAWSKIQTITAPVYDNLLVAEPVKSSGAKKLVVSNHSNTQPAKSLSWEQAWNDWETEKTGSFKQHETAIPLSFNPKKIIKKTAIQQAPVLETKFKQSLDTLTDSYIDNLIKQKKRANSFSFGKASEFILPSIALVVIFSIGYWLMNNNKPSASTIIPAAKQQQKLLVKAQSTPDVSIAPDNINVNNNEDKSNKTGNYATTTKVKDKINTFPKTSIVTPAVTNAVTLTNNNSISKNISANNVTDVDLKKTSNTTTKQFDPSVINNVPNDKAFDDAASANKGDLNAAENRPVRRRTNAPDNSNSVQQKNQSIYTANNTDSKSSTKYVSVPEYVQMNDGSGNVKIQNISNVDLDLVVVDVMYYDHSGQFKKGETLYLHNLKAGKILIIKTPRDVNAEYATSKVSLVSSDANGVYAIGDN